MQHQRTLAADLTMRHPKNQRQQSRHCSVLHVHGVVREVKNLKNERFVHVLSPRSPWITILPVIVGRKGKLAHLDVKRITIRRLASHNLKHNHDQSKPSQTVRHLLSGKSWRKAQYMGFFFKTCQEDSCLKRGSCKQTNKQQFFVPFHWLLQRRNERVCPLQTNKQTWGWGGSMLKNGL